MQTPDAIPDVTRAIQLALAPVFLLTGIAGLLNVMAGRLARIVDRGRSLTEGRPDGAAGPEETIAREVRNLERRRRFTGIAITACTAAALLLCTAIVVMFLEAMLQAHLSWLIAGLFTVSTLALVVGLAFFLREVLLSTSNRFTWRK
jgi:hypothetical protein